MLNWFFKKLGRNHGLLTPSTKYIRGFFFCFVFYHLVVLLCFFCFLFSEGGGGSVNKYGHSDLIGWDNFYFFSVTACLLWPWAVTKFVFFGPTHQPRTLPLPLIGRDISDFSASIRWTKVDETWYTASTKRPLLRPSRLNSLYLESRRKCL